MSHLYAIQFHKTQERDLLDQKKEKEETLLLEMVSQDLADSLHSDQICLFLTVCCVFRNIWSASRVMEKWTPTNTRKENVSLISTFNLVVGHVWISILLNTCLQQEETVRPVCLPPSPCLCPHLQQPHPQVRWRWFLFWWWW